MKALLLTFFALFSSFAFCQVTSKSHLTIKKKSKKEILISLINDTDDTLFIEKFVTVYSKSKFNVFYYTVSNDTLVLDWSHRWNAVSTSHAVSYHLDGEPNKESFLIDPNEEILIRVPFLNSEDFYRIRYITIYFNLLEMTSISLN